MTPDLEQADLITRREAIQRVTLLLGGLTLVGGSALLTGCRDRSNLARQTAFTADDIAFLDEMAETMLPATKTPGAKAARVGPFMALMVTDSYSVAEQQRFRDGMRSLDDASRTKNGVPFMTATPEQRLALLRVVDAEQKSHSDAREAAQRKKALDRIGIQPRPPVSVNPPQEKRSDAALPDERKENAIGTETPGAAAIASDTPAHYFRMMKELALLGYFTSEVGYTKAQRYVESPGKFEPCLPYVAGEPAWAAHA